MEHILEISKAINGFKRTRLIRFNSLLIVGKSQACSLDGRETSKLEKGRATAIAFERDCRLVEEMQEIKV